MVQPGPGQRGRTGRAEAERQAVEAAADAEAEAERQAVEAAADAEAETERRAAEAALARTLRFESTEAMHARAARPRGAVLGALRRPHNFLINEM